MKPQARRRCPICNREAVEHVVQCNTLGLTMEYFVFPCKGIQREVSSLNGNTGRVVYSGSCSATAGSDSSQ